jgi:hypothetical protein
MIRATTALALLLSLLVPAAAQADGPISLGVVPPVQMVPEDQSVTALRISLLYGRHADLTGLDLSLIGRNTGDVRGVAFAGASLVDGDFTGWQNGWLAAVTRGNLQGLQWAVYNRSGSGSSGLQIGLVNVADGFSGLQLGLVNISQTMRSGLQVGLVNIIQSKPRLKVLPLVNWSF